MVAIASTCFGGIEYDRQMLVFTILDICLKVGQTLAFKQACTYYIQRAVSITLYDGGIGQCFSRRTVNQYKIILWA